MTRYFLLFSSVLFLFFASCEDTQKSKNINTNTTISRDETEKDSAIIKKIQEDKEQEKKLVINEEPMLVQEELMPFLMQYGKENPENRVRIKTRFGDIEVMLYQDTPLHRGNFLFLTKQGYFDGTYFHRVAEGFVIQGGNSDNRETSIKRNNIGSYLIPSEFEAGHRHTRGAFSAAKYAEQNVSKASSPFEFFIVQSERGAHHLDNDHTVFGRVTKGMDVVDSINKQPVGEGEWPMQNVKMEVEIIE
ncbi:peptidylprolyl isomerase [Gillisia limnaea]|uniref:Peptidyl-prolyl cis-trans isomerase n=1 Tax=Gillisia limnaea (strain DSM 15749 / LMG 21470 / R-8282) TaxID=865937 RepID=H2BV51_GILLR|nr:peptidylprolyl isomerase [Gillisia limnaea]EHQ03941.1 peptidyl-prolyl cis-trans isomerase cyclophilin type [Gillisia limnaea DSM 15749]